MVGRDEMEQWKLGAADVLADARDEVLTANFQPMERKIEEINTVLSVCDAHSQAAHE